MESHERFSFEAKTGRPVTGQDLWVLEGVTISWTGQNLTNDHDSNIWPSSTLHG